MKLENENVCSICLEEIQLYPTTKLNCNHYFHLNCINLWKAKKNICPICRKEIILNKDKKHKSKSGFAFYLIMTFIILFFAFFIFMILKSIEKLKRVKNWKIKYKRKNQENKYKNYNMHSLFFDLILSKENERMKILKEYVTNYPKMIKYKFENFFYDIADSYNEFIDFINEFNQMRKSWTNG